MSNIFINGISAKSGGGLYIIDNFLNTISNNKDDNKYYFVTHYGYKLNIALDHRFKVIYLGLFSKGFIIPLSSLIVLPFLIFKYRCKFVINFADIPICTFAYQVFYFDWAFVSDRKSNAWKIGNLLERIRIYTKLFIFNLYSHFIDICYVQTNCIAGSLKNRYKDINIKVLPTPISFKSNKSFSFNLPKVKLFLALSTYNSYKNLEIFLPLARLIKKKNLPFKIIITIDPENNSSAEKFFQAIKRNCVTDIILNLGSIPRERVYSLYQQVHALLLPTLLESYCIPYFEAMFHELPIITSDLPFAHSSCGSAAFYFDPLDPQSILNQMQIMLNDKHITFNKIKEGKYIFSSLPSWDDFYEIILTRSNLLKQNII